MLRIKRRFYEHIKEQFVQQKAMSRKGLKFR